jgi:excisionase family DNA binding protein
MPTTDDLLTSAEVCERLNIDRSTLSRWVAAGRIAPALKMPGLRGPFLFDPAEVDRVKAGAAA